jgi:hypothetical protein
MGGSGEVLDAPGQAEFVGDPEANRLRSRAMRAPYTF